MRHFLTLTLLLLCYIPSKAKADDSNSARTLIHLLDYLGRDYHGAVQNGKVISAPEYAEQQDFVDKAWRTHAQLSDPLIREKTSAGMSRLKRLIYSKGSSDSVAELTRSLKLEIISATGIGTAPLEWPSIKHGRELFVQNCVLCHGPNGQGDGSAGENLTPPPANFHDVERMSQLSPFQMFNTIRLGVDGTAMLPFAQLSEKDVWDLAFYIASLRYQGDSARIRTLSAGRASPGLQRLSLSSDKELSASLPDSDTHDILAAWRLQTEEQAQTTSHFLDIAAKGLDNALTLYKRGKADSARDAALLAYLEGVEPLELRLKAVDPKFVVRLEMGMASVRNSMQSQKPVFQVSANIQATNELLLRANDILNSQDLPPWQIFLLTVGILLREGFEAVLVIIAILGVVNTAKVPKITRYVHGGWVLALLAGVAAWFLSGWIARLGGAQRELTEGLSSLIAVAVLLYMGFWMHGKSEIKKWNSFVREKLQTVMNGRGRLGLGAFSFLVVFREAFETVLFLSALGVDGGGKPILLGVIFSLTLTILTAWICLKFSRQIPIRIFFSVSSFVMSLLAVILIGKGIRSLQEANIFWEHGISGGPRFDLLGLFPTYETLAGQAVVLLLSAIILTRRKS